MAGVWETLFYEEKQDWISTIVNGVSTATNFALEVPCCLLALISTALIMAYDFTLQSASQVSDLLGLEEWWTLEHTLWAVAVAQSLPFFFKRAAGDKIKLLLQLAFLVQLLSMWGSLVYMLNGLQGGVVFGGKLFHPSVAFLGLTIQVIMMTLKQMRRDMAGYGHDKEVTDARFNEIYGVYEKMVKYEVAIAFFIGAFGMPKFDLNADPTTWLVAFPMIGIFSNYNSILDAMMPKSEKPETNGAPPQVVEEKKAEEKKEESAEKPAEESAEKPAEEKKEESAEKSADASADKPAEEVKETAVSTEVKKPSPVNQAIEAVCGLVCKAVGLVKCAIAHVISLVNLIKDKILGLPWDCILSLSSTLGVTGGMTFAYWSLTEDPLVLVAPSVALFAPYITEKMQEKKWLDAKGAHLTGELLKSMTLGIHYYIYRTYISLPF